MINDDLTFTDAAEVVERVTITIVADADCTAQRVHGPWDEAIDDVAVPCMDAPLWMSTLATYRSQDGWCLQTQGCWESSRA